MDAIYGDNIPQIRKILVLNPALNKNMALSRACGLERIEVVRLLLQQPRGVDPSAYNNAILIRQGIRGNLEIVRMLLELPLSRGVDPAANDNEILKLACVWGHTEIVRLLLDLPVERGVNPTAGDSYALRKTCTNPRTEIIRMLLARGANPAANDNEALKTACLCGIPSTVRMLLDLPPERGVDVAAGNYDALKSAIARGHVEIVHLLLPHVPSHVDVSDAIETAKTRGHIVIVAMMRIHHAVANAVDPPVDPASLATALIAFQEMLDIPLPVSTNHQMNTFATARHAQLRARAEEEAVRIDHVLEHDASVSENLLETLHNELADITFMVSLPPVNAFRIACEKGHVETVRFMIDDCSNAVDALTHAVSAGQTEIVRLLIERVAFHIDILSAEMIHACSRGHTEIVRLFLNVPLPRLIHKTALQTACVYERLDIIRLLLDHVACGGFSAFD